MPRPRLQGGALPALIAVCLFVAGVRPASSQSLPSPWTSRDIGSPAVAGSASVASGTFTVEGAGADIWGTSDQFHFLSRTVSGDLDVSVRVASIENVDRWAKAGVMVRDGFGAGARYAFMTASPGKGLAFQRRTSTGGRSAHTNGGTGTAPVWVRLVRKGNVFSAYRSANGSSWTLVGSATVTMPAEVQVGLAVTSHDASTAATATFTNLAVQVGLPSTWANGDIGNPAVAGSATESGGTFTVTGAGADIWDASDQFHYMYQPVQGDVEVIARLSSLNGPHSWSKAGVMIRGDLTNSSPHALVAGTPGNGWAFQRRLAAGGTSYHTAGPAGTAPGWVRLVREGNLYTAYHSDDGSNWTLIDSDTISMGSTVYVGLAVTSHTTSSAATGTFTNVTVRSPSGGNQAPTVSISSPAPGSTYTAPASIAITAAAADSDGTVSRVEFYQGSQLLGSDTTSPFSFSWNNVAAGSYSLTAVATDNAGATARSAAVSVTVSSSSNPPPTVSITSPASGATFTAPATITIAATASDSNGSVTQVDFYRGSTLIGSDTTSPYSVTWSSAPAGSFTLTAIARDNGGATATSAAVNITINSTTNQAPSVSITSPASGATFTAPANISIAASASDPDGTVARVDFYRGSTLIGSDTTSPYTATWSSAPEGTYTLTAVAQDNAGATRTSAGVSITVNAAPNQLPTVSITSPAAGTIFVAPTTITIAATAADADGTIARVDFYAGSVLLGTDTSSPYTATWSNMAAGSYTLTAVARDNAGGTRTSAGVGITVTSSTVPTTLVFTASADHDTLVASYRLAIYRASDPVTATPAATTDLGKPPVVSGEITMDISVTVNALPSGSYYAVVSAVGSGGTSASAPSATFTK